MLDPDDVGLPAGRSKMSALVKKQLKAAREALSAKNYSAAAAAAEQVLSFENSNYNGRVFLALAQLNLGDIKESQKNYEIAITAQPETPLAYQGLLKLLEQEESWTRFEEMSYQLVNVYFDQQDVQKMAEVLEKLLPLVRQHRPVSQLKILLAKLLPSSPYFSLLSSLPPPDPSAPLASGTHNVQLAIHNNMSVLSELVAINEQEEASAIARETDKRRLRLGTGLTAEQTHKAVQSEVMATSPLPDLYQSILDHPQASDEARRLAESKLLWHHATVLSATSKKSPELREKVIELSKGMVLLKIPEPKAWQVVLDWADVESTDEYDVFTLKSLLDTFPPENPLSQMTKGWLLHRKLYEPREEEQKEDEEDLIQGAIESTQSMLFPQILACCFFVDKEEWDNVKLIAEIALKQLASVKHDTGLQLVKTERMISTWLATSLVYLDAPAHHRKALKILTEVLHSSPSNLPCLIGLARVHLAAERWTEALTAFDQALEQVDDLKLKSDKAWCLIGLEQFETAQKELQTIIDAMQDWSAEEQAQTWWRLGQCYWCMGGEFKTSDDHAYSAFIKCLRLCPTYAPAFTSLGHFYMDVVAPPDTVRGSKCYQKALELDGGQDVAAHRLAEVAAEAGDWDIVEAVSRRVLAALPGRTALESGATLPSHTTQRYAWAWRAVGLADHKYGNDLDAIRALQHSLRGEPKNVGTILWLGIAYHAAGKHVAALKTFSRVVALEPDNWTARYLAAEIQRSLGLLKPALDNLDLVLQSKPQETGVQIVCAETSLALGRQLARQGYKARAKVLLEKALELSFTVMQGEKGQRLVAKIVSDACYEMARQEKTEMDSIRDQLHQFLQANDIDSKLTGLGDRFNLNANSDWTTMSILYAKLRLLLEPPDSFTLASSWADLGVLLHRSQESKPAVKCFREALKRDPRNPFTWNSLGVAALDLSPKLAQHAFIRAAEYDPRSVVPWTNLGLFYLLHEDLQLANKAFLRAQINDPDYPYVWLGQSYLAGLHGDERERRILVAHAQMLSQGTVETADVQFAQLPLEQSLQLYNPPGLAEGLQASARVNNSPERHMVRSMLAEKAQAWDIAHEAYTRASERFEDAYEETKQESIANRYVHAKLGQSRAALASGALEDAKEAASAALAPLSDDQASLRALGLISLGLAHWFSDEGEQAIEALETATSLDDPLAKKAGLLLSRVLANLGSEEALSASKDHLLSLVSDEPGSMDVITTLSALSILQRDDELLGATLDEIESLPLHDKAEKDPEGQTDRLLVAHHLLKGDVNSATRVLAEALHAAPESSSARLALARLYLDTEQTSHAQSLLESEEESAACLVLKSRIQTALGNVDEGRRLAARALHWEPNSAEARQLLDDVSTQD